MQGSTIEQASRKTKTSGVNYKLYEKSTAREVLDQ